MTQQPKMPVEVFVHRTPGEIHVSPWIVETCGDEQVKYIRADIVEVMAEALSAMIETYEHEAASDNPSLVDARAILAAYEESRK